MPPAEEAVELYRARAAGDPAYLPELAAALSNLGVGYAAVGRRAEAVTPTEEAVQLYRARAAADPAHRADLAAALNNLGTAMPTLGAPARRSPPPRRPSSCTGPRPPATRPAYPTWRRR